MSNLDLLLKRLAETGQATHDYFAGLTADQLACTIYVDPLWSARDILAHLITTERAIRPLILAIAHGDPGAPPGYDIDAANARLLAGMQDQAVPDLLAAWTAERATTIEAYRVLEPAHLESRGRHPFLGETTVNDMIQLMYRHEMLHTRDIRRSVERRA